jgi:hypothetical protein
MSEELIQYIDRHKNLFWYTPESKLHNISDSFLVETILNYGDMNAVKDLFKIMDIRSVAKIFFDDIRISERRKNNYQELSLNYFSLLFNRYVQ